MRIIDNIKIKDRVSIADTVFLYNQSRYSHREFKRLKGKIFTMNPIKFYRKLQIIKRVLYYQVSIIKHLTNKRFTAIFYVKRIERILKKINLISKKKVDSKINYENAVTEFCSKIAVYQKSYPYEVSEKLTFSEAKVLLKDILLEKIEMIYLMIVSNNNPNEGFKFIKQLEKQINQIDSKRLINENRKLPNKTVKIGRLMSCSSGIRVG